jgi:hypothetical protein
MGSGWIVLTIALSFAALALSIVNEHVLPRRYGRQLAESISTELRLARVAGEAGDIVLRGQPDGCPIEIRVSCLGYATVKVPISERFIASGLRIYETSSWGYHKSENRMLGLTVDTGDAAFDARFDVYGDDRDAALHLPERVRSVLVAHRRRGLMICDGALLLGSGSAFAFGYAHQRPDTLEGVTEMVRAATQLASALSRTS